MLEERRVKSEERRVKRTGAGGVEDEESMGCCVGFGARVGGA
jgi:hypothetical protein